MALGVLVLAALVAILGCVARASFSRLRPHRTPALAVSVLHSRTPCGESTEYGSWRHYYQPGDGRWRLDEFDSADGRLFASRRFDGRDLHDYERPIGWERRAASKDDGPGSALFWSLYEPSFTELLREIGTTEVRGRRLQLYELRPGQVEVAPMCAKTWGARSGTYTPVRERLGVDVASGMVVLHDQQVGPKRFVAERREVVELRRDPPRGDAFYRRR